MRLVAVGIELSDEETDGADGDRWLAPSATGAGRRGDVENAKASITWRAGYSSGSSRAVGAGIGQNRHRGDRLAAG